MPSILSLFSITSRVIKESAEREFAVHKVHAGQQFILQLLWTAHEPLSIGEITTRLGIENPTVTRSVQRMERQGLIKREPEPADARRVLVRLTSRGAALEETIQKVTSEFEARMLQGVTETEREQLIRVLYKVLKNLGAEAPKL